MNVKIPLWFASLDVHVFPFRPDDNKPYGNCKRCAPTLRDGKTTNPDYIRHEPTACPCTAEGGRCHGLHAATTNPDIIRKWWEETPDANAGAHCGRSNVVGIDLDAHGHQPPEDGVFIRGETISPAGITDGLDVFAALCELRGRCLPWIEHETLTVRTKSGGLQAWFRVPNGYEWRGGDSVRAGFGWQADFKAGDQSLTLPGTVTRKGSYRALGEARSIAPLPAWLRTELERIGRWVDPNPRPRYIAPPAPPKDLSRYTARALERELGDLAAAQPGALHDAVRDCSYSIGQLVGAGLIDYTAAHDAITAAAAQAGVSPEERKAQSTIRDGLNAGMRSPRQIGEAA
ncbi:bifunctional DNA primase/polymerase [Streptomyces sp. NPDC093260]|uniref:bifunctional DNA primase/polymerase n=1 Tax=Streptomyces sp. NPDC093260 TaxID=3155073 RepID=UPI003422A6A5